MVKHALLGGLLASGCEVLDVGVVATPTATLMIEQLNADGGVVITASHNPIEWNALKFFRPDGIYLNDQDGRELLTIWGTGDFVRVGQEGLKPVRIIEDAEDYHVERVLELIDVDLVRSKKFRVAVDCCNGAGVDVTLRLLKALNCEVTQIHCTPDGNFPHYPEPVFVNLGDLCERMSVGDHDVGVALDPDADRVAFVDETGAFIGEELSLALTLRDRLSQGARGPVVVNMSTSRVNEDLAREYGCEFVRTAVGEVNVADTMKDIGAAFGGEGNGGVIDPRLHYGRDSQVGIALLLEAMARNEKSLSKLRADLPEYHMIKLKAECPGGDARQILRELIAEANALSDVTVNLEDGLRIDWPDRWVHLRPSNTEPIFRVIAEAKTAAEAESLARDYEKRVQALLPA
jgi:phosphomannomutase